MATPNNHKMIIELQADPANRDYLQMTATLLSAGGERRPVGLLQLRDTLSNFIEGQIAARGAITTGTWVDMVTQGIALKQQGSNIVGTITISPTQVRQVIFGQTTFNVELPPLVCFAQWDPADGRLRNTHIYVTSPETPITGLAQPTQIVYWPWGNVYAEAHPCWGTVSTSRLRATKPLEVINLFLGAPFNLDLWADERSNFRDWDASELVKLLPPTRLATQGKHFNNEVVNFFGAIS